MNNTDPVLPPDRSTVHTDTTPYRLPPWTTNRRNRAKNRARIDKFQRNQRAVSILKNAFKRGVPGIEDMRVEPGNRDTYAKAKPVFRGVKRAVREQDREQRLAALRDDQRTRDAAFREVSATEIAPRDDGLIAWEDVKAEFDRYDAALAAYHRQAPVTPYKERGPLYSPAHPLYIATVVSTPVTTEGTK